MLVGGSTQGFSGEWSSTQGLSGEGGSTQGGVSGKEVPHRGSVVEGASTHGWSVGRGFNTGVQ